MYKPNSTKKSKPSIYVESKPVKFTDLPFVNKTRYGDSDHLLLVYKDESGNERIIRGGPQDDKNGRATLFNNIPIEMQKDIRREVSRDAYGKDTEPSSRHSKKLNIPAGREKEYWDNFNKSATKIDNLGIDYKNTVDMKNIQNSNSTIRTILQENGFVPERNIPEQARKSIPGFETDLLKNPKLSKRIDIDNPNMPKLMDEQEQAKGLERLRVQDCERELFETFKKNDNPIQDILLKNDPDISENEVREASKYSMFEAKDPLIKQNLQNKVSGWYSSMFGDNPVKTDATGRNIDPTPKMAMATESKKLSSKDGLDIFEGFKRLAPSISQREDGVNALQKGINSLGIQPELKEDGIMGPKTAYGLKDAMVNYGVGELEKRLKPQNSALKNTRSLF